MALDTALSNVIIEDNVFDYGLFATDTSLSTIPTTYGYASCIFTNSDAKITGNYFGAAINGSTQIITNGTASCIITNNTFVRGTTSIAAYINASASSGDQVITDNIFDSPTVDGFNETLVQLQSTHPGGPFVIYERNKNQTAVKQIQKSPYLMDSNHTPTINAAERATYTNDGNLGYNDAAQPSSGFFAGNFGVSSFKHQGMAMNYITPFAYETGIKLQGTFTVGHSTTSTAYGFGPTVFVGNSNNFVGYIVFGNDNKYYQIASASVTSNSVVSLTLSTTYTGTPRQVTNAVFFPASGSSSYSPLSYNLFGTFTVSGINVTASSTQSRALIPGSLISFNGDATGDIYTVQSIDTGGTNIVLTTTSGLSLSGVTATTGAALSEFNFSINLSEMLPENVQVLSTTFGVYGFSNNNFFGNTSLPIVYADYNAFITIDTDQIKYSNTLSGTFNVANGSTSVATTVSQVGILTAGSSICFASQSYAVYPIISVSPTSITLGQAYFGTANTATTGTNFNSTLADVVNYQISNGTTVGFGNNISLFIGSGQIPPSVFNTFSQYLKIDPPDFNFVAYTGVGRLLRYNLNITLLMATPGSLFFPESPLIVKYRW